MVDAALPTRFAEQRKEVPEHLLPCLDLLIDFEGPGVVPLARQEAAAVTQQMLQRNERRQLREKNRAAMNDWLVLLGIVFVVGLVTAGSALLVGGPKSRTRGPTRPAVARTRAE
jgi:hypothetical protein